MKLQLKKLHGCENDFLFLEASQIKDNSVLFMRNLAVMLCHRTKGLGADGLIIWSWRKSPQLLILNSDGSFAGTCGNALRCLGLLGLKRGFWDGTRPVSVFRYTDLVYSYSPGEDFLFYDMPFATLYKGKWETRNVEASIEVGMGVSETTIEDDLSSLGAEIRAEFGEQACDDLKAVYVELANPHWVFVSKSFAKFKENDIIRFGEFAQKKWCMQKEFAHPVANIGLLCPSYSVATTWNLTVYERGAGLTRCCGSGAVAARVALEKLALVAPDTGKLALMLPGGVISVDKQHRNTPEWEYTIEGAATLFASLETKEIFIDF